MPTEARALKPAPAVRFAIPRIRTVYQLRAEIPLDASSDATLKGAVNTALRWMEKRMPGRIPRDTGTGATFEAELPGQKAEAVSIPELGLWSARLVHPDAPFKDRPAVAGRTWVTELCLKMGKEHVDFGVRVTCGSLSYSDQPIEFTRPRVVLDIASSVGLKEGRPLDGKPWRLRSEGDLTGLRDFLINPSRSLPVVVLTQPELRRLGQTDKPYLVDGDWLARSTVGTAHVVLMPPGLAMKWTQLVGKQWSAYLGAVRTYFPGLNFDEDAPESHPRTLADGIMRWTHEDVVGEKAFATFLERQMARHAGMKRMNWGPILFFADARTKHAEFARVRATGTDDWRAIYDAEIAALKAKLGEAAKEAEGYLDLATQAERERDAVTQENGKLRFQLDSLRAQLAAKTGKSADADIPIPSNYDDLAEWAEKHLTGRLVLHPRTGRSLKEAQYEEPELVYKALLLLATEYRDMRRGIPDGKKTFDTALMALGLRFDRSISKERAGEEGDEYFVSWPTGNQRKRFLESHLRKGTSREAGRCLAIYFFWDDDTQHVVVGWLPSHLDNRIT